MFYAVPRECDIGSVVFVRDQTMKSTGRCPIFTILVLATSAWGDVRARSTMSRSLLDQLLDLLDKFGLPMSSVFSLPRVRTFTFIRFGFFVSDY